jgi:hypothetical protein
MHTSFKIIIHHFTFMIIINKNTLTNKVNLVKLSFIFIYLFIKLCIQIFKDQILQKKKKTFQRSNY